jgi:glucose-6-phosphate-specific signal transduction histidine kinase
VESGIYYLAAAAVTHLGDRPARTELHVHLEHHDERLSVRVDDPELGPGSAAALRGELAGDIERLAALGGDVDVAEYAAGVTIVAWLPDRLEPLVGSGTGP